jgi:hypothetical protein
LGREGRVRACMAQRAKRGAAGGPLPPPPAQRASRLPPCSRAGRPPAVLRLRPAPARLPLPLPLPRSPLSRVFKVIWAAWRLRGSRPATGADAESSGLLAPLLMGSVPEDGEGAEPAPMHRTPSLLWLDRAAGARIAGAPAPAAL